DLAIAAHTFIGDEAHEIDDLHAARLRVKSNTWPPGVAEGLGPGPIRVVVKRDASRRDSLHRERTNHGMTMNGDLGHRLARREIPRRIVGGGFQPVKRRHRLISGDEQGGSSSRPRSIYSWRGVQGRPD